MYKPAFTCNAALSKVTFLMQAHMKLLIKFKMCHTCYVHVHVCQILSEMFCRWLPVLSCVNMTNIIVMNCHTHLVGDVKQLIQNNYIRNKFHCHKDDNPSRKGCNLSGRDFW